MRGHVAIITKPSPHYVITESTISGRDVFAPRLSPDFSPRLRDKIWVGPGDEARQGVLEILGYWEILNSLNLPSLETRRKVQKLTLLYKFVNNLAVFPEAPLTFRAVNYPYSTRNVHNLSFCDLHGHTLQYLHSYFPDTIKLWNTLPYNIVSCNSLGAFKHALYTHFKYNVHYCVYFVLVLVWLHIHLAPSYLCNQLYSSRIQLAPYPCRPRGRRKRPGIDCLRMRDNSQKNLGIRLRLETVGKINTYTSDIFPYH